MNTLGIMGIFLTVLVLLIVVSERMLPAPADAGAGITAHNYAVLRNAADEFVLADSSITSSTTRVIAVTDVGLAPFLPAYWKPLYRGGAARWKIRVQSGLCYVYGVASAAEIAAIRVRMRHSPALVRYIGGVLVPPMTVQQADGSLQTVSLPPDIVDGSILSIIKVVP